MTAIVTTDFTNSTTADANAVNSNFTAVKNVVNGSLDNNNLAAGAAIAVTKLAAGTDGQVLTTSGSTVAWGAGTTTYRKTSQKNVVSSAAETDLLNGEVTVGAGAMGTNKLLRATLMGDILNNSGASRAVRFRIKLGGTTLWDYDFDTAVRDIATDADRRPFLIDVKIANLGANNSQYMVAELKVGAAVAGATGIGVASDVDWSAALAGTAEGRLLASTSGTVAVDTSAACAFVVTAQNEVSDANLSTRLHYALVELV